MKTIMMICRSKDEMSKMFVQLVKTLFPECEIQTVYTHRRPGIAKSMRMGGIAAAICRVQKNVCGSHEPEGCIDIELPYEEPFVRASNLSN